jgi:hypothetical protein
MCYSLIDTVPTHYYPFIFPAILGYLDIAQSILYVLEIIQRTKSMSNIGHIEEPRYLWLFVTLLK